MAYEKEIDIDCFNDEQRPFNYDFDCLEWGQYLYDTWKIDTSDEEYERYRDDQVEMAYKEKLEMEFN